MGTLRFENQSASSWPIGYVGQGANWSTEIETPGSPADAAYWKTPVHHPGRRDPKHQESKCSFKTS